MQLASYGSKALAKAKSAASNCVPKNHNPHFGLGGPGHVRSIHIPSRGPRPQQFHSATNRLFSYSRNAFVQFFAHLTAPSLIRAPAHTSSSSLLARRTLHHTSARASVQNGLTYPSRVALSRPFFLPKGPGPVVSRSVAQVGLGTARNFSSSRPIFQNLIDNVPVTGRALYEADLDLNGMKRKGKENRRIIETAKGSKNTRKGEMMKPKDGLKPVLFADASSTFEEVSRIHPEMDHYFTPAVPAHLNNVVTVLLIPLAPTPTTRTPLAEYPSSSAHHPSLLPRETLMSIHASHSHHALRVSSLFHRLDSADVWSQGVKCSAYAHGTIGEEGHLDEARGASICTVLKVEFHGWRKEKVRSVIGESGTGWCVLEEQKLWSDSSPGTSYHELNEEDDEAWWDEEIRSSSPMTASSVCGDTSDTMSSLMDEETVSQSFIMPTLDFSSSFMSRTVSPSPSYPSVVSRPTSLMASFVDPPSENGFFDIPRSVDTFGVSPNSHPQPSSIIFSDSDWEDLPYV